MIAKDIGMTHGSRRAFFLHQGEVVWAAERQSRAAARQPIQLSQQSTTGSKVAALPDGKRIKLVHFVKRMKLKINGATAEHMCVDRKQNRCANLACHRKTKL